MKKNFGLKVDPRDEKYVLKTIPQGFSPEHNKWVVEDSIRKYEIFRQKELKVWEGKVRERANALASYFKYLDTGKGGDNPLMKYFSRKTRAYLRGEKLVETLQGAYRAKNNVGQIVTYHESA